MRELVDEQGLDPVHAAYVCAQNLVSLFTEQISQLDELEPYYRLAAAAEDEYMPGGPPMSPLTTSYFTAWALFDLRFGPDSETIGTCVLDVGDALGISPGMRDIIRFYQQSRMGIYEHAGLREGRVHLRELVTNEEFNCHVPAGYLGKKGELWYVRLGPPPLVHERANMLIHLSPVTRRGSQWALRRSTGVKWISIRANYHVALTTPYILMGCSRTDWLAYLNRSVARGFPSMKDAVYDFLKHGRGPNFWNEYVFLAYHHHEREAVFLAGLPDVKSSLPHGRRGRR